MATTGTLGQIIIRERSDMNLKEQISFLTHIILLEIRGNFKWDEFRKLENLKDMFRYVRKAKLEYLGSGSSRTVFLLSNRYALKIANYRNPKWGIAQNKLEVEISTDPQIKDIVAHVRDAADDYSWIVSDLVRPIDSYKEFENLTGIHYTTFSEIVSAIELADETNYKNFVLKMSFTVPEKRIIEAIKTDFIKSLFFLMNDKELLAGDIRPINHWGKTADGRVVLLDYGFNLNVSKLYY